jgi:hypothetical protein
MLARIEASDHEGPEPPESFYGAALLRMPDRKLDRVSHLDGLLPALVSTTARLSRLVQRTLDDDGA